MATDIASVSGFQYQKGFVDGYTAARQRPNLEPVAPTSPQVPSPYLSVLEAAAYLRRYTAAGRPSAQAVYSLVKRRRIRPMPGSGGRLLFTRVELDRYLEGRARR